MNAVSLLLFSVTNSHHTGNLTQSMILLLEGNFEKVTHLLLILLAFFLGSLVSGCLFPDQVFKLSRCYGYIQVVFSLAIAIGSLVIRNPLWFSLGTVLILGLQNGMFVYYKGMIVRTTHMSGNLTDAGLAIGRTLAGRSTELWKARFQLMNLACFVLGAALGAVLVRRTDINIWLVASSLYLVSAILCFLLYHHVNYIKENFNQLKVKDHYLIDFLNKYSKKHPRV